MQLRGLGAGDWALLRKLPSVTYTILCLHILAGCTLADSGDRPKDPVVDSASTDSEGSHTGQAKDELWYRDSDGDGYGDPWWLTSAETMPEGYVLDGTDCDDRDAGQNPGAVELPADGVDQDCDGYESCWLDADNDGSGVMEAVPSRELDCAGEGISDNMLDCDDEDPVLHPYAEELCNGLDDDCDTAIDEDFLVFPDADGDGFGVSAGSFVSCEVPPGHANQAGDCDDTDSAVHPGATESCDGIDQDCDGRVDEGIPPLYWDGDGDGYGDPDTATPSCGAVEGYVENGLDCDDADASIHPGVPEIVADGRDQDCLSGDLCYLDLDHDDFGSSSTIASADLDCEDTAESTNNLDCDDEDPEINSGEAEYCDGTDNDCDGRVDADALDGRIYFVDEDLDGHGDPEETLWACPGATGASLLGDDCDDARSDIHPGAEELCDSVDNDCDGDIDHRAWYADLDADSYGDPESRILEDLCDSSGAPAGHVEDATDCDDADPEVNPAMDEICGNGIDDDCDLSSAGCGFSRAMEVSEAEATLVAPGDIDLGMSVLGADLDGDGFSDLVAGAPYSGFGSVYLVHGPCSGLLSVGEADVSIEGFERGSAMGAALAFAGDLEGDGYGDLLIGAPYSDEAGRFAGMVCVLSGPLASAVELETEAVCLPGVAAGDFAGSSLAGDVDFNGDGQLDFAVGASGSRGGNVRVLLGPIGARESLSEADIVYSSADADHAAGSSVSIAGDTDGDGFDDLLIANFDGSGDDWREAAWLMNGPLGSSLDLSVADVTFTEERSGSSSYAGGTVSGAGDLDADGYGDILIASWYNTSSYPGIVYVLNGPFSGTDYLGAAATIEGERGHGLGYSLASAADADGDGRDDILVGAPAFFYDDDVFPYDYLSHAALFLSPIEGSRSLFDADGIVSTVEDQHLGSAVAVAGDTDADGLGDILFGASNWWDEKGTSHGAAFLFLGGGY